MNSIAGLDAIRLTQEIARIPGGVFTIAFYQYNRTLGKAASKLRIMDKCTYRSQLPQDEFSIDGDNFFLFNDKHGNPKTCYRILLRFIGFPNDNFQLRKINWLHNE
jgi:hypothetical protein